MSELSDLQSEAGINVQRVDFDNGKYSVCVEDNGRVYLLRYGELWDADPKYTKMLISIAYDSRLVLPLANSHA